MTGEISSAQALQLQQLAKVIYSVLNAMEFVLLEQSIDDNNPLCYRLKYGELIRKFRLIDNKRYIEFFIRIDPVEIEIQFGRGSERYSSSQLNGSNLPVGQTLETAKPCSDGLKPCHLEPALTNKLKSFVDQADGLFKNDATFWRKLGSSINNS